MNKVCYILFHCVEDRDESMKIIGVFRSEALAHEAIFSLSKKKGFADHLEGFHIDKYTLDKVNWREGFGVD